MIKAEDSLTLARLVDSGEPNRSQTTSTSHTKADEDIPELVIRPRSGWIGIDWSEMWSHRELLAFLIWRDVSVRYKQTVLGPAWAIFQPMMMMLIFSVIFGKFAKIDSLGYPYPFSSSPA